MIASKPNILSREEYLRKKRRRKTIRLGIIFFLLVFIVAIISYISYRPSVRISEVSLSGGVLVTEKDVKEESLRFMSGSYFWLFPKNNILLYKRKQLEDDLKNKFKRIDTISIHLEELSKMIVEITERKPIAVWCSGLPGDPIVQPDISLNEVVTASTTDTEKTEELDENKNEVKTNISSCYFIDQNGTIFAEAPNFSGDAYFKYYGLVDRDSPIGKEYMASTTEFVQINSFIEAIKKLSIKPLYLKAKGEGEFSLVLQGGGEIYFDAKKSLALAYSNLETLLKSPELAFGIKNYLPVEYIDLRYGNKLFYKLKTN